MTFQFITVGRRDIRVISGYGPQESWKPEDKMPFFVSLEEEVPKAEIAGKPVIIGFDANSKLGPEWIINDPHSQSPNGEILAGIMRRHALSLANGNQDKCKGLVTRKRSTIDGVETSAIDFILLSHDIENELASLKLDEEKEYSLSSVFKI